jgi:diaminopimelate decarboxylase
MSAVRDVEPPHAGRSPHASRSRAPSPSLAPLGQILLEILRDGRLGDLEPEALAQRFGTPLYVYDMDVVERRVRALGAALPTAMELAYAVKANPALAVVATMARLGLGADVASGGELETARRAGVPLSRVVVTGPGKRDEELAIAVAAGVRAITVESPTELDRLERIASHLRLRAPVLLRAAVATNANPERIRILGDDGAGKFGMGAGDLVVAAAKAIRSSHLEMLGVHAFGASNVLDPAAIADHVGSTVQAAAGLARRIGFPLRLVDVGGGLGIPYEPHEEPIDLAALGTRLRALAAAWADDAATRSTRVLLEPGRFLVGPAGAYLARVVDRKTVDGATVVILDGGIHHLVRPALVGQEHRIRALGRGGAPTGTSPVTIAGPLCSGLDVFSRHCDLVPPAVGDLVAILDVGAYGYTESMPLFLSHPMPAEVGLRGGRAELLRPRVEPVEWLDRQRNPAW